MNCRLIDQYALDYCQGLLPITLNEEIEDHLCGCTACSANYQFTKLENEVLSEQPLPQLSHDFTQRVMAALQFDGETAAIVDHPRSLRKAWWKYLAGVAVAVAVLALLPNALPLLSFDRVDNKGMVEQIIVADELSETKTANHNITDSNFRVAIADLPLDQEVEEEELESVSTPPENAELSLKSSMVATTSDAPVIPAVVRSTMADTTVTESMDERVYGENQEISRHREGISNRALAVSPADLPSDYSLVNRISMGDNQLTFNYVNQTNSNALSISINRLDTNTNNLARNNISTMKVTPIIAEDQAAPQEEMVTSSEEGMQAEGVEAQSAEVIYFPSTAENEADLGNEPNNTQTGENIISFDSSYSSVQQREAPSAQNMIEIEYQYDGNVYLVSFYYDGALDEVLKLAGDFSLTSAEQ